MCAISSQDALSEETGQRWFRLFRSCENFDVKNASRGDPLVAKHRLESSHYIVKEPNVYHRKALSKAE